MNGAAKWVVGILGIVITLTLVVDAMQTADIDENSRCAAEASERSARNEVREQAHYDELKALIAENKRIMLRIEDKLSG